MHNLKKLNSASFRDWLPVVIIVNTKEADDRTFVLSVKNVIFALFLSEYK